MATPRKPLVFDDNKEIQQLQAGDTLLATTSGGDNYELTNTTGSALTMGELVYADPTSAGTVKKAICSDTIVKARVIGIAMEEILNNASGAIHEAGNLSLGDPAFWDIVTGDTGGLVTGSVYYLGSTAGKITKTPPVTGYITKIGVALAADLLFVDIDSPIKL